MRALDVAASVPWAILPEALRAMLALAARDDISREVVAAAMGGGSPEAVAARLGKPLENTRTATVRDGVAVIPIPGPIFRHADLFSEISGATTTDALARDLHVALDDPATHAIVLEIDSPGGELAGISELAQMIRAAHTQKPVTAYVDHLGASAAYWLASAAGRVIAAPTAMLGSIGIVMVVDDPSKTDSTDLEIVSNQSPKKRPDLTTKSGRAQVQATVDALADVFIADVARYRGVSTDTVLSDFGAGDVFVGQQAVDAGLADAVGSYEQTLRDLAEQTAPARERAAPTPLRPAGPGRKTAMGMREKFFAWLDGIEVEASAPGEVGEQEGPPVNEHRPAQPAPAAATADDTELKRLRAELESSRAQIVRLRDERIAAEALAFADAAIRDEKARPAERAAMVAAYTRAALDDAVLADGADRVGTVTALYGTRPKGSLTREELDPVALQILTQRERTTADPNAQPSEDRVKELLGKTAFGSAVLNGKGN